jgi:hypothetical protein
MRLTAQTKSPLTLAESGVSAGSIHDPADTLAGMCPEAVIAFQPAAPGPFVSHPER